MSNKGPDFKNIIKRNRGELIDLDYFKIANVLVSTDILPEERHKKIKLTVSSDTAKMDTLLDTLEQESWQSETAIKGLLYAVRKQNQSLAEKLQDDINVGNRLPNACCGGTSEPCIGNEEEEMIRIDQSIFDTDDESLLLSSVQTVEEKQIDGASKTAPASLARSVSPELFSDVSLTQEVGTAMNCAADNLEIKNFRDAIRTQASSKTDLQFFIETAWIKSIDMDVYYSGESMGYQGCPTMNYNRICKAKVKKRGIDGKYVCNKYYHWNMNYVFVPLLKAVFEDQSDEQMRLTLFQEDVEKLLDISGNLLEKLSHDELKIKFQGVKSKLLSLRILSKRVRKDMPFSCSYSYAPYNDESTPRAEYSWDNIASLTKTPRIIGSRL